MQTRNRDEIKRNYLISCLPPELYQALQGRLDIKSEVLTVFCESRVTAAMLREETYEYLLTMVGCRSFEWLRLKTVVYQWIEDNSVKGCGLPLYFYREHTMAGIRGGKDNRLDLTGVSVMSDFDIVQELYNHESATGLPASCLGLLDSRPYFCSDGVIKSCGVPKEDFLATPDPELYFPGDELDLYRDRIIKAAGLSVQLPYIAANISDRQLCNRFVEARAVLTTWGKLVRVIKVLQLPEPTGRILDLVR